MKKKIDPSFFFAVIILAVVGLLIFASASLGLLARTDNRFTSIAFNQIIFGLGIGSVACFLASRIEYRFWKKTSLILFVTTSVLALLVFIPGVGWSHGGATRWINLFGFHFQPSELLKVGYVFYLGAVLSKYKDKIRTFKYGLLPFLIITGIVALLILPEPDNDTFFMTALAGFAMYFALGARMKHIMLLISLALAGAVVVALMRPYVVSRIMTFLNPGANSLTSGYQIEQSLIAIGSGGLFGKGFGQSTQKFNFLPEPIGDSIFAVAGEEFGFLGSTIIVILYAFFATRGFKIASRIQDDFGRSVIIGLVTLIVVGSFLNIAAMLAIIPLTGTPLMFISQGGTALLIALIEVGVIFNISKYRKSL